MFFLGFVLTGTCPSRICSFKDVPIVGSLSCRIVRLYRTGLSRMCLSTVVPIRELPVSMESNRRYETSLTLTWQKSKNSMIMEFHLC
jgi:hypothetical protein